MWDIPEDNRPELLKNKNYLKKRQEDFSINRY